MKNTYGLRTDLSMKTVVRIDRVQLKFLHQTTKYLKLHNLTFNQFKVLEVLYHVGNLNISAITKLTMSTAGNITVVVKNLKRDKWIETIVDDKDRRSTLLSITQKGKEVIEKVFPNHAKNLKQSLDILSDEELQTLYTLLDKVYKAN